MNKDVYIIVPVYNEAGVVREVVCKLLEIYRNVVVVDDGSTDDSLELLKDTGAVILRHVVNLGQGAALQTGLNYAISQGTQYIVTFDADGQHQVEDIDKLLDPLKYKGYEVALGSRFIGHTINLPKTRRFIIKIAVFLTSLTSRQKFTDSHNGLKAFHVSAAKKINITQNRMAHASQILEQIVEHRMKYVEVPVSIIYTDYSIRKGQPSLNALNIIIELLEEKLFR